MKVLIWVLVGLVGCFSAVAAAQEAKPVKAAGAVELKDAAGDMGPISTSDGDEPALDVTLLAIKSDGKRITFTATLKDTPGRFATAPVTAYIDSDNNAATGAKLGFEGPTGFEYKAEISLCIKYDGGGEACSGAAGTKVASRHGAVNLDRFKGKSNFDEKETVVDSMGFGGSKASIQVPVTGKAVEASFEYADIKVKPGQTIRVLAQETGGSATDGDGYFPVVLLTLK